MTKGCLGSCFPSTISVHGFRSSTAPHCCCFENHQHGSSSNSSSTDLRQPTPPSEQHISRWTLQTPHLTSASLIICLYFHAEAFTEKKKISNSCSGNVTDLPKHPPKQSQVSFRINGSYILLNRTVEAFELGFKGVLFYLEALLFVKDPILRPSSDLCF